jgi:hypothetical protein
MTSGFAGKCQSVTLDADVQRTGFTSLAVQEHISGQRSLDVAVAGTHPPTRLHPNNVAAGLRNPQNRFSGSFKVRIPVKTIPCAETVWSTLGVIHLTVTSSAG